VQNKHEKENDDDDKEYGEEEEGEKLIRMTKGQERQIKTKYM
jgi:hypothetical protein